jgi:hypothetical protein
MNDAPRSGKRLRIADKDITAFLAAKKISRSELAGLLNINPASLSRWADPRNPQEPTSTAFLVLIPLLLAAGIDILPPADPLAVDNQIATFQGLGLLKEGELKNERVRKSLHRALAILSNEDVKASRRLFTALQEAWKRIDESLVQKR